MQPVLPTTPFGRRPYTLAQMEADIIARERPAGEDIDKKEVFKDVCTAQCALGVSQTTLTVLDALLSFHPSTVLSGEGPIIVFPSNKALTERLKGMPEGTLRNHLRALSRLKLILRRDSPNGKRYARKGRDGKLEKAFGFDLAILAARAEEFHHRAEETRAAELRRAALKELVSVYHRDIKEMIAAGRNEGVRADWDAIQLSFKSLRPRLPREPALAVLEPLAVQLESLIHEIRKALETHIKINKMDGNDIENGCHIQNSKQTPFDLEPGLPISQGHECAPHPDTPPSPSKEQGNERKPAFEADRPRSAMQAQQHATKSFPLGMVLDACPDIVEHAPEGVRSWQDLIATAEKVRPWLGVSPSAWEEAVDVLGRTDAAAVLAAILQRSDAIASPGGYLRSLTAKARAGTFSLGPMLMALNRASLRKGAGQLRA